MTSSTHPGCQWGWLPNTMILTPWPWSPSPIWFSLPLAYRSFTSHTAHLCLSRDPTPHRSLPTNVLKIHLVLSNFLKQRQSGLVISLFISRQSKRHISHCIILPLDSWDFFFLLEVHVLAPQWELRLPKSINFHIHTKLPAYCITIGEVTFRGKESEHKTICSLLQI